MQKSTSTKLLFFSALFSLLFSRAYAQSKLQLQDVPNRQGALERSGGGGMGPSLPTVARPLGYLPSNVVNARGTYTDLGTRGTRIRTPNNNDDDYSGAQAIGFAFRYRGKDFSNFVLNTNGFIVLGTEPGSQPDLFLDGPQSYTGGALYSAEPADSNIIAPFNVDLAPCDSSPAEFRMLTAGPAGQRVCTIQWKNMKDKASGQLFRIAFQVKLYETTNFIEFVYGDFEATEAPGVFRSAAVGIRGVGSQVLFGSKYSGSAWTATAFITDPTNVNQHNYRNTFLPDAGRTYRFTTTLLRNVGISSILDLPGPACNQGVVDSIGVVVINSGSTRQTNIPLSVRVDRNLVRSAQVPALDSGQRDTIYVGPYDFSAVGNYGVEAIVSLPNDQLPGNDTLRPDSVQNIVPTPADGTVNSFEDERSLQGWLAYNLNNDGFRWTLAEDSTRANRGSRFLYLPNNATRGSNDLLLSSCYGLVGRHQYKLRFHMTNLNQVGPGKIEILVLKNQSGDTTGALHIWRDDNFTHYIADGYIDTTVRFFALDTGAHYIGFYVTSTANTNYVALDDVSLDSDTGLLPVGLPKQVQTGYRIVPNPSGPHGFSVEGLSQSTPAILVDALGRRRELMLRKEEGYRVTGGLAPGIYSLQVGTRVLRLAIE